MPFKPECWDLAKAVEHIYANTKPEGGCLVTTRSRGSHGYAQARFCGKQHLAHRLVARYYLGPCPDGMEVRHMCGRGHEGCVTASHLRYGTRSDNVRDMLRHGVRVKLSREDIADIRRRLAAGEPPRSIAADYPVNRATIDDIKHGRTHHWY